MSRDVSCICLLGRAAIESDWFYLSVWVMGLMEIIKGSAHVTSLLLCRFLVCWLETLRAKSAFNIVTLSGSTTYLGESKSKLKSAH